VTRTRGPECHELSCYRFFFEAGTSAPGEFPLDAQFTRAMQPFKYKPHEGIGDAELVGDLPKSFPVRYAPQFPLILHPLGV
jgi:hypothetical protein